MLNPPEPEKIRRSIWPSDFFIALIVDHRRCRCSESYDQPPIHGSDPVSLPL